MLTSILFGGLFGGVGVVLYALVIHRKLACATCNTKPPLFRRPSSAGEAVAGGWTCAHCGTVVDRKGRPRQR